MFARIRSTVPCLLLVGSLAHLTHYANAQDGTVELAAAPRLAAAAEEEISSLIRPALGIQEQQDQESVMAAEDEGLTPLQSRELLTKVAPVNVSMADIGTGLLPEPPASRFGSATLLPDGNARGAIFQCVHWRASQLQSNPLYFQDVPLERYGHHCAGHLQPLVSGAKFYSTIALYPYLRTLRHPQDSVYALGHYRPGTAAPCLKQHIPYDKRAAAVETLSLAAFFWAMPL